MNEMKEIKALKTTTLPDGSTLHVVRERVNDVIKRIEVFAIISHVGKGTPPRSVIMDALATLYSKSREVVVIRNIKSEYGIGLSRVRAHIYESIEKVKAFEPEYILKRHEKGVKGG